MTDQQVRLVDDGDADNTDDCLDTCVEASCGDTYTQAGVEDCDDQNADNTDACLDACVSASCGAMPAPCCGPSCQWISIC